ncbi:alpha/beta fold hydrolase [Alkalilimnicola ehrlichii MLHE-1]|uniref:Alpha/beta hydrolase fold protein n=1 Tax=Alkalilimnicola ehrlichii (strain ATCC BAA-1101 / DSM 17681 / MLHE-1) TaxID=187272 RepID=Q0A4W6_ALKEH|nr:alpha/beta fold hydrolase [Alkalilimnicola ehrlichii]ABI58121.1 alpha/beta hydrolase fold protein [Alkalilimnicola ehrlichii MLHE-1]
MTEILRLNKTERGDGPPLLILHGLYGSSANWSRHARWLAERHRVILPDLRNHGRSPHHPRMDYPAMAADLVQLLDDCGCAQALVMGHSMGGKAAMALALEHPERVSGLVVADIAPVDYGTEDHGHDGILAAMAGVDLDGISHREQVDTALAEAVDSPMVRQFLLTNLQRGEQGWEWRIPVAILRQALPTLMGFPDYDGQYAGPALFIHGERSGYVQAAQTDAIRRLFPHAEITAVAGAGHWLHVEQPERFAEALDAWLRRR